jgi:serine/threonine protein kinase
MSICGGRATSQRFQILDNGESWRLRGRPIGPHRLPSRDRRAKMWPARHPSTWTTLILNDISAKFEVDRHIRTGAYFDAYQATDKVLDRTVFLKLARPANDAQARRIVEAHVACWRRFARTRTEGIPAVLDIGEHDGRWFLVTEWIPGRSLKALLDAGGIENVGDLLFALSSRCLGILGDLHLQALLHGDINPGNILVVVNGRRLTISLVDPAPVIALPNANDPAKKIIFGTPRFLAPEVLAGHPPTPRSDLFALGTTFEYVTQRLGIAPPRFVKRLTASSPLDRPEHADDALSTFYADLADNPIYGTGEARGLPFPGSRDEIISLGVPTLGRSLQAEDYVTGLVEAPGQAPDTGPVDTPPQGDREELSVVSRAIEVPMEIEMWVPLPALPLASDQAETVAISVPAEERPAREVPAKAAPATADFLVVAPSLIQAGRSFVLEVWVAPSGEHSAMVAEATRGGRMIERGGRSHLRIDRDTLITVILRLPDFELPDPIELLGWNGDIRNVGFIVKASASLAPGIYPGSAKLMQNGIPFASIMFDLEVASAEGRLNAPVRPRDAHVQRMANAFASYARLDRAEVLRRVQGIQAVGTQVFLDIVNLRSGADWEKVLYSEIDGSDCFLLFWSRNAAQSSWVEREWRYALNRRGVDFINPLPLEDPRLIEPPSELRSKHFNDMLLAFIKSEDLLRASRESQ